MKKNLFKKVVCAASALTMMSSLAISASAEERFVALGIKDEESVRELEQLWGETCQSGEAATEEAAALIAEHTEIIPWEKLPFELDSFCLLLCANGEITVEEYLEMNKTLAACGTLPDEFYARINSLDFLSNVLGNEKLWDKAGYDPEFVAITQSEEYTVIGYNPQQYGQINWPDYYAGMTFAYITDNDTEALEGSDVLVIPEKVYLAALQIQNSGSGDINGSGALELTDAILLARAVGGSYELSAESRKEADLNGDGAIDGNDLTKLVDKLAGK